MFNCLCINDLFALQRYKNFWTFLLFPLCFKALSTIYLQVGNFSKTTFAITCFLSVFNSEYFVFYLTDCQPLWLSSRLVFSCKVKVNKHTLQEGTFWSYSYRLVEIVCLLASSKTTLTSVNLKASSSELNSL